MHKVKSESEVVQSCPTLCNSMDCNPPGSSVQGIFQARVLEWVVIAFNQGQMSFQGYKIIKVIQMKVKFTDLPKVFVIFMKIIVQSFKKSYIEHLLSTLCYMVALLKNHLKLYYYSKI